MAQTVGSCKREFHNLESPINGCLHGFGTSFGSGRSKNGTGSNLGELVQDGIVVFRRVNTVSSSRKRSRRVATSNGTGSSDSKGHFDYLIAVVEQASGAEKETLMKK